MGQITIGHLGHFLLDFLAQIWTQGPLRHILGPILVIFEIWQFLTILGPFEYFSEKRWSQKINVNVFGHVVAVFRWFKFTLKPPYSIARGKLRLAIWDTSFWTFWLKFGHKGPLRHILGPILVIFEIWQFLTILGPFEYFSKKSFLDEGAIVTPLSV